MSTGHLLSCTLAVAVPLRIEELRVKGGPSSDDFASAKDFSKVLGEKGDVLLFGSKKKGETADMFNRLAKALAVMAFLPGGVKVFGNHWEAKGN